jgi:hypothetical protein
VADQKRAINRMTDTIEGLSHEFQFDRRTTQTMNQQNSDPPPVEEDVPVTVIEFFLHTHARPSHSVYAAWRGSHWEDRCKQ